MRENQMRGFVSRVLSVLLALAMALALTGSWASAVESQSVRVGYFAFDGYHMTAENGVKSGYGYDLLQEMALYSDWTYEYVGYDKSWSEMQDMLENGEIDLLTSAQKTEERMERFDFSDRSIGTSSTILTVKSGDNRYAVGDYASYDGMRVGMLRNSSRNDSFADFAQENGFSYTPVYFDDTDAMAQALQQGNEIDAIVTSSLRSLSNEWLLEQFDTSDFYIMVQKGNTALLDEINYALERMDADSPGWRTELDNRYYAPDSGDEIAFSGAERSYLAQIQADQTVFRAIVSPDRAPYSYFEDGQAKGIMVDIFRLVAQRAGIQYEIVETADRAEYNQLIKEGQIDIRIDSCFDFYDAESNNFKLTDPYLTTAISLVNRNDFSGTFRSVAALEQADITRNYHDQLYGSSDTLFYPSIDACLEAVRTGEADCTYTYAYTAQQAVQADQKNQLQSTLLPEYSMEFSVGVSNLCDHRLLALLNKGVDSLQEDTVQQIVLAQTDFDNAQFTLIGFLYSRPLAAVGILGAFCACVFIIVLQLVRAKNAEKSRTQEARLARFMGYVCQANDIVLEVNLKRMMATRYFLRDGEVVSSHEPYHHFNYENYQQTIHPDDFQVLVASLTEEAMDQMIDGGGGQKYFEARSKKPDGSYEWCSYTIRAIPKDKEHPRNFILFKKNINEAKQQEQQQKQALTDALETARRASAAKGVFLSRMSHEIRTPLNAVIGYMTIAKISKDNPDKVFHCIANSEIAAKHLLSIINDVLDISSIESGRLKIANEDFDLKQLLSAVSTMFYNQCKAKDVQFQVQLHDITEEWVIGDQLRLNQILMNLLSNAVKFTPAGGNVSLIVTQVMIASGKVHLKFQVRDTGVGMSPEYLTRMFTPFEQESATTAQKYGGTGLGLSITKNLITMMGGSIDVESAQGEGTTFTVLLSFAQSQQKSAPQTAVQHDFSRVRALVVDDEKSDCDYIKALFKRCGVKSDTVYDGEHAVQQIKRREGTDYAYDLCIMDWNMPGLDGIETARRIRSECSSELPIIIATAYDISDIDDAAREVGVSRVVSKPLFQSTLFDLLVSTYGKYQPEIPDELSDAHMQGLHILLAEDNEMNREIAVEVLQRAGVTVDCAVDGRDAVEQFTAAPADTYQAILMDIQMPVMNGYEATRAIRQSAHPRAAQIPIIAMTANAFAEDVTEALACGMNDHIAKPIDYAKLFRTLNQTIKNGGTC